MKICARSEVGRLAEAEKKEKLCPENKGLTPSEPTKRGHNGYGRGGGACGQGVFLPNWVIFPTDTFELLLNTLFH